MRPASAEETALLNNDLIAFGLTAPFTDRRNAHGNATLPAMAVPSQDALDRLASTTAGLLREHPQGLSEHALIQALRASPAGDVLPGTLGDLTALFRAHFLLFHVLFRLRDELRTRAEAELVIDPLRIRLLPSAPGRAGLERDDALRRYYQDLDQLDITSEDDVARLLAGFHARLHGGERRTEALAELGLEDPVSDAEIKQAYRRLAQRHHPDRGGDAGRLQALNAALATLLP